MIPAWGEILFALPSPLPEREAWLHTYVTALPRSNVGKAQHAVPREEKEPLASGSGNAREAVEPAVAGTAVRWQDKCPPLPVQRDGSLAAKET